MKIDVYDTYAKDRNGQLVHFDVFVKEGTDDKKAYQYALEYLGSIGNKGDYTLEQSRCNFCHTETANTEVKKIIEKNSYYILEIEGCPKKND